MKRLWLMTAVLLSSCSGGQSSGISPGDLPKTVSQVSQAAPAASCTITPLNDPGQNVGSPVGSSTTDAWAAESPDVDTSQNGDLAHFVNGVKTASYTVPGGPSVGVRYSSIAQIRMIDGAPWAIASYIDENWGYSYGVVRFDGTKLVPYSLGSFNTFNNPPDIGGSQSTGIYVSGTSPKGQLEILRFNGTSFVLTAVAPYTNLWIANAVVFNKDIYALLTQNQYDEAVVAHWNGSSFTFHNLSSAQYGGNASQITGTSPTDLWAATGKGIWRYNGTWQPYAYQPESAQYGDYMEGVVEFNSRYVVVPTMYGINNAGGALVYNGVERFLPLTIAANSQNRPLFDISSVPGTTSFYGTYEYLLNGYLDSISSELVTCPALPPA